MTVTEYKKLSRLLKNAYKEAEKEFLASGGDPMSEDFGFLLAKVRAAILEKTGFTEEDYRSMRDKIEGLTNAGTLSELRKVQAKTREVSERPIPTEDEIREIALEVAEAVAKTYVKPPQITNQIVKEIVELQPIKETVVQREEYDPTPILEKVNRLEKDLYSIEVPPPYDDTGLKQFFQDWFSENLKKNIDILGMPDFRKMGIGLRQDIDTKVGSPTTHTITVASTAPANPQVNDLWYDIS